MRDPSATKVNADKCPQRAGLSDEAKSLIKDACALVALIAFTLAIAVWADAISTSIILGRVQ